MEILSTIAILAATTGTDSSLLSSILPYAITIISSIVTGWVSYSIGSKKNERQDFDSILDANAKFREEVRRDLQSANDKINGLNEALKAKDKEISDMQLSITDLQNQLMVREVNISDLNVQILGRDMKIAELEARMNSLGG